MSDLVNYYKNNKQKFEYALHLIRQGSYEETPITKKNGSNRIISKPHSIIKNVQREVNEILQINYNPPSNVHGFIKSFNNETKTILTNANKHTKKKIVMNFDIEGFFDSIHFGRVYGLLLAKPFLLDKQLAAKFATLFTYKDKLPQGAPTSPIISNIICIELDHKLVQYSKKQTITYTRYADDLTFSTNRSSINIPRIEKDIVRIINKCGFKINKDKTRVQFSKQRQIVTGLIVNKKVNIKKDYIKRIRAMLHSWQKDGIAVATNKHFNFEFTFEEKNFKFNFIDKIKNFIIKLCNFKLCNQTKKKYIKRIYKNNQYNKYSNKEICFQNILLGHINFLGQIKGKDNSLFLNYLYQFYLIKSNFKLDKHNNKFEEINLFYPNNITKLVLTQLYDTRLIFTEGITDIRYLKFALKFFQNKGEFNSLRLRFCSLGGWVNLQKLHIDINKISKPEKYPNEIIELFKKNLRFAFILDADELGILKYKESIKDEKFYIINSEKASYIEQLLDANKLKSIIQEHGYIINPSHESLTKISNNKIKEKLEAHLRTNTQNDIVYAIENFIVYKDKLIKKTSLAERITSMADIDYSNFKEIFLHFEKLG